MIEDAGSSADDRVSRIEPDARIVVLARTVQAEGPAWEAAWDGDAGPAALGDACLGRALYRHRSVFRSASDAPHWSHLELGYYRAIVPAEVVHDLVFERRPEQARLLRAEILLTTPSSFVMPRGWRGSADRPGRQASLEYIDVRPGRLADYREMMRRFIGPAAARLVAADRVGTFRAMETAAVLYRDPSFDVDWNQIHLCEVEADTFEGFGREFDAALRDVAPDGSFAELFAGLDRMRTIPRWTFSDVVAEADLAFGRSGSIRPARADDQRERQDP